MSCAICQAPASYFATATFLGKHEAKLSRCTNCGFVQTEDPFWLDEAYSVAITGSDVGLVKRNLDMTAICTVVISLLFNSHGTFVDYAGGYGLFVRLMRDSGFDFVWNDKYCDNLFAQGLVAQAAGSMPVEMLTAFEVFEHFVDPVGELERMLTYSRNILFTTQLLPEPAPKPDQWWYYGVEHGQHIAFYTRRSFVSLAERFGLNFYTNGTSMHLFTEKRLSPTLFSCLALYKTARFLAPFFSRSSLLLTDCGRTTASALAEGSVQE